MKHFKTLEKIRLLVVFIAFTAVSSSAFAQCDANAGPDLSVCEGETFTLGGAPSAFGGVAPYSYDWSGLTGADDMANPSITLNSTTTFTLTITDSNGCSDTDTVTITVTPLPVANAGADIDPCVNTSNITLPNAGVWSGAPSTMLNGNIFSPNTVGTYTLTYTVTANGCSASDNKVVVVRPRPVVNAGADAQICQGECFQLNAVASSANGPITLYSWSGGPLSSNLGQSPIACPTGSGATYSVTVVDSESCNAQDQITISFQSPIAVNAGSDLTLCNSSNPVSMTGNMPSGGVWSGTGVDASGNFTSPGIGSYTLTYTVLSPGGCTYQDTRTVTVVDATPIDGGNNVSSCVGSPAFMLNPNTPGGTWSGSTLVSANGLFNPTLVGSYNLVYSVNSGVCTSTDNVSVTVFGLPTVDAGLNQSVCSGSSVTLNGTANGGLPPYTISWSNSASLSNASILNPNASPTSNTSYVLTVSDNRGCESSDFTMVSVNPVPAVDAGPDLTLCNSTNSVVITGQTPAGGSWSGTGVDAAGNFISPGIGTYTLTYTYISSVGCSNQDTRVINVVGATPIDAGSDASLCVGSPAFSLNAVTPGGTWGGSAFISSNGLFTPTLVGTYNLVYSVNTGVCTSTDNVTVSVFGLPTIDAGSNQSMCEGNSVFLNGSANGGLPPYTISWTNGASLSNTSILNPSASPSSTTSYTLTVLDDRGCMSSDFTTVTVNTLPSVNAGSDITTCDQSGPIQLTGQTPAGGTWSGSCVSAAGQFTPCGVGTFNLTYTYLNASGCSASDTRVVTVTASPSVSAGADISVCRNEGIVDLSSNASSAGVWSGAGIIDANNGIFNPISAGAGSHTITLTIGTGVCQVSDHMEVQVKAEPNVNTGSSSSLCLNAEPLELEGIPSHGIWEGSGVIEDVDDDEFHIHPSSAGIGSHSLLYRYTDVTTSCSDTSYKVVSVNALPIASFTLPSEGCIGAAQQPVNNSTSASSYIWNFGEGSNTNGTAPQHTYNSEGIFDVQLIAVSANSCRDTVFQTISIISAPTVSITSDVAAGCGPLDVNFSSVQSGSNLNYLWNYGNTNTSSAQLPTMQTYVAGTTNEIFTAGLTVSNACGSATDEIEIQVMPQPMASFVSSITGTVCSPVNVIFQNTSIGDVSNCTWDFGDGETLVIDNPSERVYTTGNTPTTYDVELTVSNACGTSVAVESITVQPNLVHASISASTMEGCNPLDVAFVNNGTGGTQFTYEYSNGNTQLGSDVSYTFNNAGQYTIYQYATDGCGFDTAQVVITALQTPMIDFTASADEACQYAGITFSADVTYADNILWQFGDGESSTLEDVVKAYNTGGTYEVTLTGTSANTCSNSETLEVTIHSNPVALFNIGNTEGCAPFDICPINGSVGAAQVQWIFGDGSTSDESQPCHSFQNTGNADLEQTVILNIENSFGCTDSYEQAVVVHPLPASTFDLSENTSCDYPQLMAPINVVSDVDSYSWTIDGMPASQDEHPNLFFASPGIFYIELETTNSFGCTNTSDATFVINERAEAIFDVDKNNGCLDLLVNFINQSTNAAQYIWNFGDGDTSTGAQPVHSYDDQGVFDVSLVAISAEGCSDTLTLHNVVETYPLPVANFKPSSLEASIFSPTISFENLSEDGVSYQWYFGNNETSVDEHPEHEFASPGHWAVTLVTTNMFGCEDRVTKNITVTNDFQVYIPNSFTPNNDGLNDVFRPELEGREFVTKYEFIVFNRWGEKVYETNDPKMAWTGDAKSNGHYAESETYSYQLTIQLEQSAETKVYRGLVTMIK